jgi:hypothetical protein
MLNLEMEIYFATIGAQMTLRWANEEEYQLVKKTLVDDGALWFDSRDARFTKPDFVYLENERQYETLRQISRQLHKDDSDEPPPEK